MNFPLVSKLLGVILLILALAFAASLGIAYYFDKPSESELTRNAFLAGIATSLAGAGALFWVGRRHEHKFFRKEALCVIGIGWLLASLVGSIPYLVVLPEIGFSGAYFETASGFTTTGASVLSNLEELPQSLLFWRSLTQWIGGMGVVVFFVAILGFIGVGAKMLYANEASGSISEFEESRVQSTVARLVYVYMGLTGACVGCFWLADMSWLDAVNHAFTTVSTGGFSTRSLSLAAYRSPAVEWVAITFMVLGGINFLFILRMLSRRWNHRRRNTELTAYLAIIAVASIMIWLTLMGQGTISDSGHALRAAAFQVVSIMTTTGFATEDFAQWTALPQMALLVLMLIGGCTGSTAGGIKVYRLVIAFRATMQSVERSFRTRVVRQVRMNNQVIESETVSEIMSFLVLVGGLLMASLIIVSVFEPNLRIDTNASAVMACMFNIGPGLAEVGPMENFAFLHPYTKLYLALLMILGRLELYAILALFAPSLWKRFA